MIACLPERRKERTKISIIKAGIKATGTDFWSRGAGAGGGQDKGIWLGQSYQDFAPRGDVARQAEKDIKELWE